MPCGYNHLTSFSHNLMLCINKRILALYNPALKKTGALFCPIIIENVTDKIFFSSLKNKPKCKKNSCLNSATRGVKINSSFLLALSEWALD